MKENLGAKGTAGVPGVPQIESLLLFTIVC